MADFYCDHGAYASVLGTVPTWGVPQEGDGSTKDAATASSVASIDLTAITSTAGTFSLFGSSAISVGAGASGATLAAQIVSAINGSSVTTGNATIFPGAPQLRNAFYARNTGAVLEIMCRIGSAMTNVLGMTWAGTWSAGPPANLTFSGGSGGCWGWFVTTNDIGVGASILAMKYGAWLCLPYVGVAQTVADRVFIRTGGGNKTLSFNPGGSYNNFDYSNTGYSGSLIFDTNTIWTTDSGNDTLTFTMNVTGYSTNVSISPNPGNTQKSWIALRRGGFRFVAAGTYSTTFRLEGANTSFYANGIEFAYNGTNSTQALFVWPKGYSAGSTAIYENCDYYELTPVTSVKSICTLGGNDAYSQHSREFIGCNFNLNISGATYTGSLVVVSAVVESRVRFSGCNFRGFSGKFKLLPSNIATYTGGSTALNILIESCTGVEILNSYAGLGHTSPWRQDTQLVVINNLNDVSNLGLRIEDCRGIAEWLPFESPVPPTLSAVLPNTLTPWSVKLVWLNSVALSPGKPYKAPPLRLQNSLPTGLRTFTLELFIDTGITKGIQVTFKYFDNLGNAQTQTSEVLLVSSANWNNAAAFPTFAAKKIVINSAAQVLAGYEITCDVNLVAPVTTTTSVFIDPEFRVT